MQWIKSYDYSGYANEQNNARTRHREKSNKNAYIDHDLAIYAFNKYATLINEKEKNIQKEAGYTTSEEFEREIQLIGTMQAGLKQWKQENFPDIETTIENFSVYSKEVNKAMEKMGYTTQESLKQNAQHYEIFTNKAKKLAEEQKIETISQQLVNPTITT
jgi:hypothetical protein